MNRKRPGPARDAANADGAPAAPPFEARILHLVQGTQERRALVQGELDAILDPVSGRAILLPDAQHAVLDLERHFRALVSLACDGYWELDENLCFTACSGIALGASTCVESLGRSLWDLDFERGDERDWQSLRLQMSRHVAFDEFELSQRDSAGVLRYLTLRGEPKFDGDGVFRGYRGVAHDVTGRRAGDGRDSAQRLVERATLNAIAAPVCVLNEAGVIVSRNSAWQRWNSSPMGALSVGSHYLTGCQAHSVLLPFASADIVAGLAQVVAGERALFRFEQRYACDRGPRWVEVCATALHSVDDTQLLLVHEDITTRKRSAQWLALEGSVAARLANAADATAALQAVLAAVCEHQHWDCGQYFEHDASSASLSHVAQWGQASASAVSDFLARSPSGPFRADAGLSGRVCQARQPLWLRDAHSDERLASALPHEVGLRGVFMFPVSVDGLLLGVLAFGSCREISEPDEAGLRSVANIGHLLGHFLRRGQELTHLRRSEQRFRRYTALGCDWQFEMDRELRLTATTEVGLGTNSELLGKRLWELPQLQVSEDEWSRLQAELAAQWSFCDFALTAVTDDGRESHYHISGEPIFDAAGMFCGFLGIGLDVTRRAR